MPSAAETPLYDAPGLYRRLLWLTLLRIALVTLLLCAAAFVVLRADVQDLGTVEQVVYGVIIATYLASLGYLLALRRSAGIHKLLAYAQLTGDVFISSCLVYVTGGAESVLVFMFPLAVVSAAVLLHRRGAIVAAVASCVCLATVVVGLNSGEIPPASDVLAPTPLPLPRLLFFLFGHAAAIFLTAALASHLAEQARSTGERLTRTQHDYKALELLHESIVRSITSGICTSDRFGRITFLNRAGEEISCLAIDQVRGQPMERHFPVVSGRLHADTRLERFEADHARPDRTTRRLSVHVAPLVDREGIPQGHVVAFQDLTGIRAMEEAVRRSEKLAAVGAMAAGLAHELRNPLASMGGSIQLLAEGKSFGDEERRLMTIALREADRLNGLISDFLTFARPSPPSFDALDARTVIEETLELFRNDPSHRSLSLRAEVEGALPVRADAGQLRQVLWNLLKNAAESLDGTGSVRVAAFPKGATALVQIIDTGGGIDPTDLPHIFDPFYTTKSKGTGLGLALVHSMIAGHGGRIEVASELGKGTTFTVHLPLRGGAA